MLGLNMVNKWNMRAKSQVEIDSKLLGTCSWSEGEVCTRDGKVGVRLVVTAAEL